MNINLKFLLGGVAVWLFPQSVAAQCAETDCLKLGYTSLQKCDGGLKCPFGEYWACPKAEEKAVLGACTGYAKNCKIGDILNSDGTCTTDKINGKNPIGVVAYIGDDNCGWAIAREDLGKYQWSIYQKSVPGVKNTTYSQTAAKDYNSCGNTREIINDGDESVYPAAWATVNYAPSSAPETKGKWCLPSEGILNEIYIKQLSTIDMLMAKIGGANMVGGVYGFWSSTEYSKEEAWVSCLNGACSHNDHGFKLTDSYNVRPVIEF